MDLRLAPEQKRNIFRTQICRVIPTVPLPLNVHSLIEATLAFPSWGICCIPNISNHNKYTRVLLQLVSCSSAKRLDLNNVHRELLQDPGFIFLTSFATCFLAARSPLAQFHVACSARTPVLRASSAVLDFAHLPAGTQNLFLVSEKDS